MFQNPLLGKELAPLEGLMVKDKGVVQVYEQTGKNPNLLDKSELESLFRQDIE